jgi:proteic killer suppression protein
MLISFACKETKRIWEGESSRKFPADLQSRAFRKLRQINAARSLEDLKNPPGNNLEHLRGSRSGHMSMRINQQWRLVFVWDDGNASDVAIVDYH